MEFGNLWQGKPHLTDWLIAFSLPIAIEIQTDRIAKIDCNCASHIYRIFLANNKTFSLWMSLEAWIAEIDIGKVHTKRNK